MKYIGILIGSNCHVATTQEEQERILEMVKQESECAIFEFHSRIPQVYFLNLHPEMGEGLQRVFDYVKCMLCDGEAQVTFGVGKYPKHLALLSEYLDKADKYIQTCESSQRRFAILRCFGCEIYAKLGETQYVSVFLSKVCASEDETRRVLDSVLNNGADDGEDVLKEEWLADFNLGKLS